MQIQISRLISLHRRPQCASRADYSIRISPGSACIRRDTGTGIWRAFN